MLMMADSDPVVRNKNVCTFVTPCTFFWKRLSFHSLIKEGYSHLISVLSSQLVFHATPPPGDC
jgi:hypothetical protein